MLSKNKFFHDRLVLLLISVNTFLTVLTTLSVLFRLQGNGNGYIVQYRSQQLGIGAYTSGSVTQILAFVGFAVLVLVIHTILGQRTYHLKRELSVVILGLGTLLLIIGVIISNALLMLR